MNYYCYFQMGMVKREEDSMITYSIGLLEGDSTMPRRGIVLSPIVYFLEMRPRSPPLPYPPALKEYSSLLVQIHRPQLLLSNFATSPAS